MPVVDIDTRTLFIKHLNGKVKTAFYVGIVNIYEFNIIFEYSQIREEGKALTKIKILIFEWNEALNGSRFYCKLPKCFFFSYFVFHWKIQWALNTEHSNIGIVLKSKWKYLAAQVSRAQNQIQWRENTKFSIHGSKHCI